MQGMDNVYISLLTDVMKKKEDVLDHLIVCTMRQTSCFKEQEMDEEAYNAIYEEKAELLEKLEEYDQGFEQLYQRAAAEIKENKEKYKEEIILLQKQIKSVTDKGMQISRLERRNKERFEVYMNSQRRVVKQMKVSRKTAATYYNNMMKQTPSESFIYDKLK